MHDGATRRQFMRVKCGFMIRVPGNGLVPTYGDVSVGGASFTLASKIGHEVEVLAGDKAARAKVLAVTPAAGQYTYRVQFEDVSAGEQVFSSIFAAA